MPRNGSGTYSLPEPPFIAQTPISSGAVNNDLSDIATALTASLPRDGQAGMSGLLSLAQSGFAYAVDADTGIYRSANNEQTIKCGGIDVVRVTTTGMFDGVTGANLGFVVGVPYPWIFPSAPTGCVLLYGQPCTSSYPIIRGMLVAAGSPYGNNGTDPLFPNMQGVGVAGKSNMSGTDRGNLAGATVLGATIGAQTVALTGPQVGPHTHTGSGTSGVEDALHNHPIIGTTGSESQGHTHSGSGTTGGQSVSHTHPYQSPDSTITVGTSGPTLQASGPPGGNTTGGTSVDHNHTFAFTTGSVSQNHTHSMNFSSQTESQSHRHPFSFTTDSGGAGDPHPNVQPTIIFNWIMRVA